MARMTMRDEMKARQEAGDPMPCPPFPPPDSPMLPVLMERAMQNQRDGIDIQGVIVDAIVYGWMEGYLHAVDGPVDPELLREP